MPFARSSDDSEDVRRQGNLETIQRKGAFQRKKRHLRTQEDVTARLSLTSKSRRDKEDREKDFRHNHEQTRQPKYDYSYGNYEVDDDTSHRNKKNKSIDELEESKKNERHVHKNKEHSDKREIRKHKKTRDHKDKSKRDSHHSRPKKIIKRRKSIDDEERERECSNEHYEYANDILNNDSDTNEDVLRKRLLKQSTLEHDTDENQINSISSIIEKNLDIILEKAKEDCENYSSLNQDDDADDEDGGDSPNKYSFDNEEMDDPANQSYNTFHNVRSKFESGSIEMSDAEIDYNNIHHNNSMSDSSSSSTSSYGSSISSSRNPKKKKQRKTNSNDVNIEEKLVFSPVEYEDYSAIEVDNRPFYYPAVQGCRLVEEFECLNKIEEGTYGVVFRARDRKTNEIVALKRLKMEKERDGFPITSLREINTLMKARHINIVTVREIVVGSNMDKIYLVMDFIEHDLKSLMLSMVKPFEICEVKCLMLQLLHAVAHLHDNWILHRDLKTSNLLLSHRGVLKVADFGLAREYGSPLKNYTRVVVTLWYRAPELLLGTKVYSTQIDLWSVGCIFGELLLMAALFPGKSEMDQINILFRELGTPNEKIWPGFSQLPNVKRFEFGKYEYNRLTRRFGPQLSESGLQLINRFLAYCPERRITADEAIRHHYFNETPLAISPEMFPTRPAKSEGAIPSRARITASPKPPSGGGQGGKCLNDDDRIIGIEHMYLRRA